MRLARKLAKAVVVLALAGGALGGAAALGSTLFETPPRDAAEFAERVEAGGEPSGPAGVAAARKASASSRTEARYIRAVEASCREQIVAFEDLGRPATLAELETYLERVLALARRYERQSLGVPTPRRYRAAEARYESLGNEGFELLEAMLAAARRRDPDTIALLGTRLLDLAEEQNDVARDMGALDCVVEAPVAAY